MENLCYSIRENNMFLKMIISNTKLSTPSTILSWLDTLEKLRLTMILPNIIGGQDYGHLSRTLSKDVPHVNSSKLIETQLNPLSCQYQDQNHLDTSPNAQWI